MKEFSTFLQPSLTRFSSLATVVLSVMLIDDRVCRVLCWLRVVQFSWFMDRWCHRFNRSMIWTSRQLLFIFSSWCWLKIYLGGFIALHRIYTYYYFFYFFFITYTQWLIISNFCVIFFEWYHMYNVIFFLVVDLKELSNHQDFLSCSNHLQLCS